MVIFVMKVDCLLHEAGAGVICSHNFDKCLSLRAKNTLKDARTFGQEMKLCHPSHSVHTEEIGLKHAVSFLQL
jgi:hypothetical protein